MGRQIENVARSAPELRNDYFSKGTERDNVHCWLNSLVAANHWTGLSQPKNVHQGQCCVACYTSMMLCLEVGSHSLEVTTLRI